MSPTVVLIWASATRSGSVRMVMATTVPRGALLGGWRGARRVELAVHVRPFLREGEGQRRIEKILVVEGPREDVLPDLPHRAGEDSLAEALLVGLGQRDVAVAALRAVGRLDAEVVVGRADGREDPAGDDAVRRLRQQDQAVRARRDREDVAVVGDRLAGIELEVEAVFRRRLDLAVRGRALVLRDRALAAVLHGPGRALHGRAAAAAAGAEAAVRPAEEAAAAIALRFGHAGAGRRRLLAGAEVPSAEGEVGEAVALSLRDHERALGEDPAL